MGGETTEGCDGPGGLAIANARPRVLADLLEVLIDDGHRLSHRTPTPSVHHCKGNQAPCQQDPCSAT